VADRSFELQRQLGDGAFGTVYLADMVSLGGFRKSVAIKLLKPDWDAGSDAARRLRDEARLLGRLRHRHIVAVDDLIRLDGRWAVVMEYVPGVDLQVIIEAAQQAGERVPPAAALEITAAVAQALDAAYNGLAGDGGEALRVVHRDIKPSNIRLTADGDIKVLDFGIARADFQGREARTDKIRYGSVGYMAPERLLGDPEVPAGDIYAVGVVLWELLCLEQYGRTKLAPERAEAELRGQLDHARGLLGPDLDPALALIAACMDYAVGARPTARQVAERARALARSLPGPDLHAFARDFVPRIEAATPGTAVAPRQLTEEQVDSSTFHFDAVDPGITAAPLTGGSPVRSVTAAPVAEGGTLGHELASTDRRRRSPVAIIAGAVALAVVAVGLGLWATHKPAGDTPVPAPAGSGAASAAPAAPAAASETPPAPDEAADNADEVANNADDAAAKAETAGSDADAPATDASEDAQPAEAPASATDAASAARPSPSAPTTPDRAPSAGSDAATDGVATTTTGTALPAQAAPATASAPPVDRAKFLVPGASRIEVDCQGVTSASSSSSVYVKDFPAGSCRVQAKVDGKDLSDTVSVRRAAGYTCTPTGTTLSCETM